MATKIKRIYKSFKYITQMFDVKDQEMEIGYPTDVKHVTHIGLDGSTGSGPSWMSDFETASDFSTSFSNLGGARDPNPMAISTSWSSQDFEECTGSQPTPNAYKITPPVGAPLVPKKSTRKKVKSTSSSESLSASSRQSSRTAKSKGSYIEIEATPIAQARFKM
ncbi:hypothetical protein Lal_00011697 [Lupinus albus]|uniref:Putative CRIB domain-containing protein n=1 Tax=Lupinus albus TaxID=3870 RepID=A0A6A5N8T1_LUPAL|nr:putative CRIB domain-containing protein [Lupinus albus]KAF1880638.1 hypothetical protein Lal_00011697 [Lupinus albus]